MISKYGFPLRQLFISFNSLSTKDWTTFKIVLSRYLVCGQSTILLQNKPFRMSDIWKEFIKFNLAPSRFRLILQQKFCIPLKNIVMSLWPIKYRIHNASLHYYRIVFAFRELIIESCVSKKLLHIACAIDDDSWQFWNIHNIIVVSHCIPHKQRGKKGVQAEKHETWFFPPNSLSCGFYQITISINMIRVELNEHIVDHFLPYAPF